MARLEKRICIDIIVYYLYLQARSILTTKRITFSVFCIRFALKVKLKKSFFKISQINKQTYIYIYIYIYIYRIASGIVYTSFPMPISLENIFTVTLVADT